MVETLIALALSGVLLAGTLQVFKYSTSSYRQLSNLATVHENARFALHFLLSDIQKATAIGSNSKDNRWKGTDEIHIKLTAAATYTINVYKINKATGNQPSLYRKKEAQHHNSIFQNLIENIEDLQIKYGVDGDDSNSAPDFYANASELSNSNWDDVVSVQINLTAISLDKVAQFAHAISDNNFDGSGDSNADGIIRKRLSAVVALRNHPKYQQ